MFQYFLRVVPTTYIDAARRRLATSQYAVTDYSRSFEHGQGVPGIFFKYDLEGMSLTVEERTTTLYQFLIRLVGVIGECAICPDPVDVRRRLDSRWLRLAVLQQGPETCCQTVGTGAGNHSVNLSRSKGRCQLLRQTLVIVSCYASSSFGPPYDLRTTIATSLAHEAGRTFL